MRTLDSAGFAGWRSLTVYTRYSAVGWVQVSCQISVNIG